MACPEEFVVSRPWLGYDLMLGGVNSEAQRVQRVFKSSGASEQEVQAMRVALDEAGIHFEERPGSMFGGGQGGLWVEDRETVDRAKPVIKDAQARWTEHVRANPDSVQAASIFGSHKRLVWVLCIIVVVLHIVLISELLFGWG